MRTIYQTKHIKNLSVLWVLFSAVLLVGCSGYQSVSYYEDGIYGEPIKKESTTQEKNAPTAQQSGTYYKNYFADKASQGVQNDYIFTSPEEYQSPTPDQSSSVNYQAHGSWGDQTNRININLIYNRPFGWGWDWYYAPFNFGRIGFWGYNYHPWYFTYGHFHNPYYNPYRFGWGHYNPYHYPYWGRNRYWSPYNNAYWDRNYDRRLNSNPIIYNRLNGGRGDSANNRSYSRSRTSQSPQTDSVESKSERSSLRNNMRRSRSDRGFYTKSNEPQQTDNPTRRSRSTDNSYTRESNSRSNNNRSLSRSRSSSNSSFSRTSAGSRNSGSSSSRSSSSRRR